MRYDHIVALQGFAYNMIRIHNIHYGYFNTLELKLKPKTFDIMHNIKD